MRDIGNEEQIYWVRENEGKITAALMESAFSKDELKDELDDMRKYGPIRRVLASRVTIGEALKASA